VIVLRSESVLVRIDPLRGGELLDLIDLSTGRQLLAQMPFSTVPPTGADVPEGQWLEGHRGGWQLLTPNAGNACQLDGVDHGFHGAASRSRWAVRDQRQDHVTLEWHGHGLGVTRSVTITEDVVTIDCAWHALGERAPLIAVEHLAVGPELLDPSVEIRLPTGTAYELSETDGPVEPLADGLTWPRVRLLDGSEERADRWSFDTARSRYMVIANLPDGQAEIRNGATGCGLRLEWDHRMLPHAWLWHEVRSSQGPWHGAGQLLMIEPASVPHGLGLETAVSHGQAIWAEPDARYEYRIAATVLR
jgi:hypothetical protein